MIPSVNEAPSFDLQTEQLRIATALHIPSYDDNDNQEVELPSPATQGPHIISSVPCLSPSTPHFEESAPEDETSLDDMQNAHDPTDDDVASNYSHTTDQDVVADILRAASSVKSFEEDEDLWNQLGDFHREDASPSRDGSPARSTGNNDDSASEIGTPVTGTNRQPHPADEEPILVTVLKLCGFVDEVCGDVDDYNQANSSKSVCNRPPRPQYRVRYFPEVEAPESSEFEMELPVAPPEEEKPETLVVKTKSWPMLLRRRNAAKTMVH